MKSNARIKYECPSNISKISPHPPGATQWKGFANHWTSGGGAAFSWWSHIACVARCIQRKLCFFLNWNTSTDSMPCIYRCENKPTDDLPALFIFSFAILNDQTNHRITKSTYLNLQLWPCLTHLYKAQCLSWISMNLTFHKFPWISKTFHEFPKTFHNIPWISKTSHESP